MAAENLGYFAIALEKLNTCIPGERLKPRPRSVFSLFYSPREGFRCGIGTPFLSSMVAGEEAYMELKREHVE